MDMSEIVFKKFSELSKEKQNEVINFIDYLGAQNTDVPITTENTDWAKFSMLNATKGMEDEPDLYSLKDIKEKF